MDVSHKKYEYKPSELIIRLYSQIAKCPVLLVRNKAYNALSQLIAMLVSLNINVQIYEDISNCAKYFYYSYLG